MTLVKLLAQELNIAVLATIHQPSYSTLQLFDEVLVLAEGKSVYHGPVNDLPMFCQAVGHPVPPHANPADHIVALVNRDFGSGDTLDHDHLRVSKTKEEHMAEPSIESSSESAGVHKPDRKSMRDSLAILFLLLRRTLLNYSRNLMACECLTYVCCDFG